MEKLAVGTRIQFTRTITEPADGDHPTFLLAKGGDEGVIVGYGEHWPYSVVWDGYPKPFYCEGDEFVPAPVHI